MTTILDFVRHGHPVNVDGYCFGQTDRPLSEQGRDAIESLARRLDAVNQPCVSSDLLCARESAARLTYAPVSIEPRLREMHFGEWEDRTWAEIEAQDPARLQSWMTNWVSERAPGGESFTDVVARVRNWLASVPTNGSRQIVVAHAGAIRAAAVVLLDLPPERAFGLQVDHAHVSTFSLSPDGATLRAWNSRVFQ